MDKVEKIKIEIERKKNAIDYIGMPTCAEYNRVLAYNDVLEIIDSLEEEFVSEDLGDYINELSKQFPEVSFVKLSRIAVSVSRWQQNQDVKNKQPKVTNRTELDEYAYQCAYDMSNDWMIENPTWHDVEDACKLGANWQKEQMIKDAIEGMVEEPESLWWRIISDDLEGEFVVKNNLHDEDRVKMIIIKEE